MKHLWKVLYKVANFFPILQQTWPPSVIFVFGWSITKKKNSSETAWPISKNLPL
jgi:hypothetical protein